MIREGHLEVYDLALTTQAPLFVGSGKKLGKKEYLYQGGCVTIPDQRRFFDFLAKTGRMKKYEDFILSDQNDLWTWLTGEGGFDKVWLERNADFLLSPQVYRLAVTEDVSGYNGTLELRLFQRNAKGEAYIPGSSLKGALRTVWLANEMMGEPTEKKRDRSLQGFSVSDPKKRVFPESSYTNRLKAPGNSEKRTRMLDSIFRGVQISDSEIIPNEKMILTGRTLLSPLSAARMEEQGFDGHPKNLPLFQECVCPDETIRFKLTLDRSLLERHENPITRESLLEAIRNFSAFYNKHFMCHFPQGDRYPQVANMDMEHKSYLVLGGGAGFFSKTVDYPYMEENESEALDWVCRYMSRNIRTGNHRADRALGIAPHRMKYMRYGGKLYPAGFCKVDIR